MIDEKLFSPLRAFAQEVVSGSYADKLPLEVQSVLLNVSKTSEIDLEQLRHGYFLGIHGFLEENEETKLKNFHRYGPFVSAVQQEISSHKPLFGSIDFSLPRNRILELVGEVAKGFPKLACEVESYNGEIFLTLSMQGNGGPIKISTNLTVKEKPYVLVAPEIFFFMHSPRPIARFSLDDMFGDCRQNLIFSIDDLKVRLEEVFLRGDTFLGYFKDWDWNVEWNR